MRIRSTRPEFFRSKTIAKLDWSTRYVLKALESYVDDNGVGKDDITLIATDAFPRDLVASPPETLARLTETISALSEAGLVVRYQANNEALLYIDDWKNKQRVDKPSKGRYPRPDGSFEYAETVDRSKFASVSGTLASPPEKDPVGTGEQGNRGTVLSCASATAERVIDETPEAGTNAEPDAEIAIFSVSAKRREQQIHEAFIAWYENYPRKKSKADAVKAFKKAIKSATLEQLVEAVDSQREQLMKNGIEFCPYPATWLNAERWLDEEDADDDHPYAHLPRPQVDWDAERAAAEASRNGGAS